MDSGMFITENNEEISYSSFYFMKYKGPCYALFEKTNNLWSLLNYLPIQKNK